MSQADLARKSGLSHGAVSRLESGQRPYPDPETIDALALALNASDDDRAGLYEATAHVPSGYRLIREGDGYTMIPSKQLARWKLDMLDITDGALRLSNNLKALSRYTQEARNDADSDEYQESP
jgi:transcriptional regulator with XRE-family HTH domain